jgi:predicted nucleotidyltransferase component of viral defense system
MTLDYSKHKAILLQILKDIYSDTSIAPYLGFKGGTAALLFYDLNRNSVDLDFDLLDETKETEVFEKIQKIASSYGTIIDSHIKKFNLLNVISYAPGAQKIKVEINRRQFGSHYELMTLLGISMLVMVEEDMYAHKVMAMYERVGKTSRDIFDVYYFEKKGWDINKVIVEERSGLSFKEALSKCIELLDKMDNKHILDGLGELLTEPQKDWARAKLREETIFLLKVKMDSLGMIDTLPPYTSADINAIRTTLNDKFFKNTPFVCEKLTIKKDKLFFEKNGSDEDSHGYAIECELLQDGKKIEAWIDPITTKVGADQVAHLIAHTIWSKFDGSMTSQLWKNFPSQAK